MAGSRKLEVEIVGNADSLKRAFGQAGGSSQSFGKSLLKTAAITGAVVAGYKAVSGALGGSIRAAAEAEVAQKKLQAQLKASGISYRQYGTQIDDTLRKQSQLSAFDDEDLSDSFTQLVRVTGDVNKALELNALAADYARAKGVGLEAAAMVVTKAQMGQVGALRRAGIEIEKVTAAQDALGKGASEAAQEQAKAADLAATKQAAIAALQEKFAGQAKAYGDTAAGAQERFRVAMENLGEVIGQKVLPHIVPLINGLTNFINKAAESEKLAAILKTTGAVISVVLRAIGEGFRVVAAFAQRHWGEVQAAAERVRAWYQGTLAPAIQNVLTAIQAFWNRFGTAITAIVKTSFGVVFTVVKTTLGNVASAIEIILAVIRGDWGRAWDELKEIPRRTLSAVVAIVRGFGSMLYTVGKEIATLLKDGVVAGLAAAKDAIVRAARKYIVDPLKAIVPGWGSTPYTWARDEIGRAVITGAIDGLNTSGLPEKMREKVDQAIEAARRAIESKRSVWAQAADALVNAALSAFDRLSSEIETKAEKQLRLLDEKQRKQQISDDIAAARAALAAAQAALGGVTRQEGETDTDYAARLASAKQAIVDAQKQLDEALLAQQRYRLEQQAARERAALDERRALQRRKLEEQLADANSAYERGAISLQQYNQRLVAIMKKYHIPWKEGANALGLSLAAGLNDAWKDVQKAAKKLAETIVTELSTIRVVIGVNVSHSDNTPGRQHGGPVRAGSPYIVGERGPELFVPKQSGQIIPNNATASGRAIGGAPNVTVNVYGSVTSERDLVETIRNALIQEGRRKGGNLLAGYA